MEQSINNVEKFFEFNQDELGKDPYGELTHIDSETFLMEQLIIGLEKIEKTFWPTGK